VTKHAFEDRTLPAMLSHWAERQPDRAFAIDNAGTLTWAAAHEEARAMSAAFAALGIEPGDTVGLMLENRRELLTSWLGLAHAGGVEVPINPAEVGDRLVHIIEHCGCQTAVVGADCVEKIDAAADRLSRLRRLVVVGGDERSARFETLPFDALERDPRRAGRHRPRFGDPVAVMYTSGSTGPPKGVVISHGHHFTNGQQPTALFEISPSDLVYVALPLHHNMGQGYGVWVALASGASVRIAERFRADEFWSDVRAHGATILPFVGAMLVLLAKQSPHADDADNSVRVAFGVPIPRDLHEPFERRFGLELVHAYGSTEATIVAWNRRKNRKIGPAGPPLPDYEVCVMDDEDRAVGVGVTGQICIRPREPYSMFSGYFKDPQRTVEAWRNLWFHTGDRGWLDADGDLWFSDRIGDVVRRMGEFISSQEVERVVLSHPDVRLCAAYGVPSELIEEELMVAVVAQSEGQLTPEDLRAHCAQRLPRHAVPRFIEFVDELPMTATGKVEKYRLKARGVTAATDDVRHAETSHGAATSSRSVMRRGRPGGPIE
jgi:crotonobetaine/carnitine-CoA ligase